MEEPLYLSGQLLLAMPGIGDPRFEKAVIAMCVHDEEGALGIGLGRIVPRIGFHELLKQLDIEPGSAPDVEVAGNRNTTGGGDSINFQQSGNLKATTTFSLLSHFCFLIQDVESKINP